MPDMPTSLSGVGVVYYVLMAIIPIPQSDGAELALHQLRALQALLRERSLTRAAKALDIGQPALSKTLAQLRRYFGDPLFVRVSQRMEPTPKALELGKPVAEVLERVRTLRDEHARFDPAVSSRTFQFCVVDAGVIKLLPPLLNRVNAETANIRFRVIPLEGQHLEGWLESGTIDFAMGAFPGLGKEIRRQFLWTERYVSLVSNNHPRLRARPSVNAFAAENHILVSTFGTGHANKLAEAVIESRVPPENIICRVPGFIAAAVIAKHTNMIATIPESIAKVLADDLELTIVEPPLKLPRIDIYQYWHNRFNREPGSQWVRSTFAELFRDKKGNSK
jgi:DNA-binding transcriptional LysR family regulator